ncbi:MULTISPECIES: hypothetical protein [unclassified Thiocapsa]
MRASLLLCLLLSSPLVANAEAPVVGPDMNAYYHGADSHSLHLQVLQ